ASIKALPLFLAHLLAHLCSGGRVERREGTSFVFAAAIPIACIAAMFAFTGALDELLYCTLQFNASHPVHAARRAIGVVFFFAGAPAFTLRFAQRLSHLAAFAIWYPLLVLCFWPIVGPRDLLPLAPLIALWFASRATKPIAAIAFVAAIAANFVNAPEWERVGERHRFVDAVTRLTSPNEFVYDFKGDAIFRRRPVRMIYDVVGRTLTRNGVLADRGPEEIVAHGCVVAIPDSDRIPARTRAFLNAHFIKRGDIRVCGVIARGDTFTIVVPHTYAVFAHDIAIDGIPYHAPRFLAAGRHTISGARNQRVTERVTILASVR
ncbi:MAG TPA: hypothetical protein VJZ00_14830, partial [Thermoanaerobaculia bacterium]|nr:hypothetical protein [Thermoanaerobaculia bacterium]